MEANAVRVPEAVLEGLEGVRRTGLTNMLDRNAVQYWADHFEYFETVVWIEDNPKLYAEGIFRGFEAETPDE